MESRKQNAVEKRLSESRKINRNTLHHMTHTAYGIKWYKLCKPVCGQWVLLR